MVDAKEIGKKAALEVVDHLEDQGWKIQDWDPKEPHAKDIIATSNKGKMMVHVQSSMEPNNPPHMTQPEIENMKERAKNRKAEAYEARVKLDGDLKVVGDIGWNRVG